jgi:hypothetical protein
VEKTALPTWPHNFLASTSTFDGFLEKFCEAKAPYWHPQESPRQRFYCMTTRKVMELVTREQQVFGLFEEQKNAIGALTRRIKQHDDNKVTFAFSHPEYAREFGRLNGQVVPVVVSGS